MGTLKIVTFNCEWREPAHPHGQEIARRIVALDPDIVCLTEAHLGYFEDGHEIASRPHDAKRPTRRKVVLWSKEHWVDRDERGDPKMLAGRYLAANTLTGVGDVRVHGVVIPYRFQDVRQGCTLWRRHLEFLGGLDRLLPESPRATLLLGDFNQRVPRRFQPQNVYDELQRVVLRRFSLASSGHLSPLDKQAIDHICYSRELESEAVSAISNFSEDGQALSDHFGIFAKLVARRLARS